MEKYKHLNLKYQSGYIIAKAKITDCIFIDNNMREELHQKNPLVYSSVVNDKDWIGYGFKLEEVESIAPIKINGRLNLWDYDYKSEIKQEKS